MKICNVQHRPRSQPGTTYYCILPPRHKGRHRGIFGMVWGRKPKATK